MQKLFENWRQYLKEENLIEVRGSKRLRRKKRLQTVKKILRGNNYLKDYADEITDRNLINAGHYIFLFLPDTFKHAKTSHMRESDLPGSKFSDSYLTDESLLELVVKLLKQKPKPDEVDSNQYGTKLKWFNTEMGEDVGEDSIIHKDEAGGAVPSTFDFREKIRNNRGIPSIMSQGLKVFDAAEGGTELNSPEEANPEREYWSQQDVPVIDGPLQPTDKLNLIVSEIGEIEGKKLISLITVFPGVSEPSAMNKKDYAKLGYYFLTGK
jgi:hypothetical protein